jgi:glyoxylase-like metal-dependent hydrolase (beta-lactamase superfamily II)
VPVVTTSVGSLQVLALLDASGPFFTTRREAFPDADDAAWERARELDPGAFGADDAWHLDFRCFAVRGPGENVTLVDTGVGPAGSPAAAWAPVPGRLPGELRAAGIEPTEVDTVVLTHLHADHYGWSVDAYGAPFFPNARYVVQRDEVTALSEPDTAMQHVVRPLRNAGQLHEVAGETRLTRPAAGAHLSAVPTPGHTPGHQSVLVADPEQQVIVTGDVLVHAVQLVDPAVSYRYESDQDLARRSRTALLERAARDRALLATAHLTRPFVPAH